MNQNKALSLGGNGMKLKLRRFMAYLLVVMMLISVLPSSAFAEIAQAGSDRRVAAVGEFAEHHQAG